MARFPLESELLEILLAFEESDGLAALASRLAKDPSVVSRRLQFIAEAYPVLEKVKGRWTITPLGREVNKLTREISARYGELLTREMPGAGLRLSPNTVLLVINAQRGLLDATLPGRSNLEAEANIASLLAHWRQRALPVVHVKHVSENPGSPFYREAAGADFLPALAPVAQESVVEKTKASAFTDTSLEEHLRTREISQLVIVGFTANECIDATARDAAALSFTSYVVSDATALFDVRGPDGKLVKAERLQRLTLANIHAFYARVLPTNELLARA